MADVYGGTLRAEIASTVADGDHVIVLTRGSGTVRGEPVAWTGVHVWSFDQGLATRFVSYGSAEYQWFWASGESAAKHRPRAGRRLTRTVRPGRTGPVGRRHDRRGPGHLAIPEHVLPGSGGPGAG